jgi:hypothetical protein
MITKLTETTRLHRLEFKRLFFLVSNSVILNNRKDKNEYETTTLLKAKRVSTSMSKFR